MRRDNGGATDKAVMRDRADHQGCVFLRHAERVATHVFIDDQIADNADFQLGEALYRSIRSEMANPCRWG